MEKYWQSSSKGPSGRHPTSSLTKRSFPAGNPGLSRGHVLGSGLCILCRRPLPLSATQQTGLKLPSTITVPSVSSPFLKPHIWATPSMTSSPWNTENHTESTQSGLTLMSVVRSAHGKKLQIKFAPHSCFSQRGLGVGSSSITWDPVQKWGPHPGPNESKSVFLQNSERFLCMLPLAWCWLVHRNWAYELCLPTYTFGWNAWVPNQHCALPTCLGYQPPAPSMLLNWRDKSQPGTLTAAVDTLASILRTPFPRWLAVGCAFFGFPSYWPPCFNIICCFLVIFPTS